GVQRLREATQHWAAPGTSGVIGTTDEWEPAAAAYANAAASIAHDWDDYLYMGHTGHSAVWAARSRARRRADRAGDRDRALPAAVRPLARVHGAGHQAADRGRAGRAGHPP